MTDSKKQPEQTLPYLAIKNWNKFQQRSKNGMQLPWFRDYTGQSDDPAYASLSLYARGVLQECRRLVQRTGRNIPFVAQGGLNPVSAVAHHVSNSASAPPQDRINVRSAIAQLIAKGFLTPTESADPYLSRDEMRGKEMSRDELKPGKSGLKIPSKSQTTGLPQGSTVTEEFDDAKF